MRSMHGLNCANMRGLMSLRYGGDREPVQAGLSRAGWQRLLHGRKKESLLRVESC